MSATVRELLERAADLDRLDAEFLLADALNVSRAWLVAHSEDRPGPGDRRRFIDWVNRRRAGEPVAYLTGWREFWTLRLRITPDTLIPRPETEELVEHALAHLDSTTPARVLDLGTGSGAIALAIASERPSARVFGVDSSLPALVVARENSHRLELDNVRFDHGDWYEPVAGERFDLVVANPPYVAAGDPHLDRGDCAWEPRAALTPGEDGLAAYRRILAGFDAHAEPGAWLIVEHGYDQREALEALFREHGLGDLKAHDDLSGIPRVLAGRITPGSR